MKVEHQAPGPLGNPAASGFIGGPWLCVSASRRSCLSRWRCARFYPAVPSLHSETTIMCQRENRVNGCRY